MEQITAIKLAEELFKIHEQAEILFEENPEQITYRENDIINLLQKLGFPEPDFDGYGKQCERELLSCPGDTIRETLEYRSISIGAFIGMLRNAPNRINGRFWHFDHVSQLLQGKLHIDDDVAEDLERVLGIPKQFWLNREKLYREKLEKLK